MTKSGPIPQAWPARAMKIRRRKRRFARAKSHAEAGEVEFELAFSRLVARIYLGTVKDMKNDIKISGMTPIMPPYGADLVASAQVFLADDTTEQTSADLETFNSVGRSYLRRRAQKRKAARKSALRRFGKKRTRKRRSVRSRIKAKGPRLGAKRK